MREVIAKVLAFCADPVKNQRFRKAASGMKIPHGDRDPPVIWQGAGKPAISRRVMRRQWHTPYRPKVKEV